MRYVSRIGVFLFWLTAVAVALVSYRFLALGLETAFPGMLGHIADRNLIFILHISVSPLVLVLGLLQFLPRLRTNRPAVHRWSGRLYGVGVLVGGLAGLFLAIGSFDRPIAALGFGLLAMLWIGITAQAIRLAMAGRISEHRQWMTRSYSLTFAAVTLRLALPFFFILGGMEYAEASSYVAWISWVPNLLIAEWYLRHRACVGAKMAAA
ncbi:MAG: DUF2306 domain-containing protein [Alphaproteobacteria bacterium]